MGERAFSRRDVLHAMGAGAVGAVALGATGATRAGTDADHYHNPVYSPHFPDPSVVRAADGTYYAYASNMNRDSESTERLVPIIESTDLVNWRNVGVAFESPPEWYGDDFQLWAPAVAAYDGQYYVYYTAAVWGQPNPGIGVATANSPRGPFTDHGKLFTSEEIGADAIDAYFQVVDGTPYLIFGGFGAEITTVELNADGLDWVRKSQQPIAGPGYEAPYVIQRNGRYYLFCSRGSCCSGNESTYHVVVGRSDSFFGPYVTEEGVDLRETPDTPRAVESNPRFTGPGHCSAIRDDADDWWLLYHGYDVTTPGYVDGTYRRELFVDRLVWDNGWPKVGCHGTPTGRSPMPHTGSYDCSVPKAIPDGTYYIENGNSEKVLAVAGASTQDGANVVQQENHTVASQQWLLIRTGAGHYRIENVHSGKLLDVEALGPQTGIPSSSGPTTAATTSAG